MRLQEMGNPIPNCSQQQDYHSIEWASWLPPVPPLRKGMFPRTSEQPHSGATRFCTCSWAENKPLCKGKMSSIEALDLEEHLHPFPQHSSCPSSPSRIPSSCLPPALHRSAVHMDCQAVKNTCLAGTSTAPLRDVLPLAMAL